MKTPDKTLLGVDEARAAIYADRAAIIAARTVTDAARHALDHAQTAQEDAALAVCIAHDAADMADVAFRVACDAVKKAFCARTC